MDKLPFWTQAKYTSLGLLVVAIVGSATAPAGQLVADLSGEVVVDVTGDTTTATPSRRATTASVTV